MVIFHPSHIWLVPPFVLHHTIIQGLQTRRHCGSHVVQSGQSKPGLCSDQEGTSVHVVSSKVKFFLDSSFNSLQWILQH